MQFEDDTLPLFFGQGIPYLLCRHLNILCTRFIAIRSLLSVQVPLLGTLPHQLR